MIWSNRTLNWITLEENQNTAEESDVVRWPTCTTKSQPVEYKVLMGSHIDETVQNHIFLTHHGYSTKDLRSSDPCKKAGHVSKKQEQIQDKIEFQSWLECASKNSV